MYACYLYRKLPEGWKPSAWRSGLPRYAMREEFYWKILDFEGVYASCHAGMPPPPPPKLVRQDADEPIYWSQMEAMEEGRTPIKAHAEVVPFAPLKEVPVRKFRMISAKRLEYDSDDTDDDTDDDMYV
jgi:hypothetical protein